MKGRLLLTAAIVAETTGTLALRGSIDHAAWLVLVVVAYVAAFTLISFTLRAGMSLSVVYGIWGAAGVLLVALLGAAIFGETLSPAVIVGIIVIIVGVVLVETGADHPSMLSDEDVS